VRRFAKSFARASPIELISGRELDLDPVESKSKSTGRLCTNPASEALRPSLEPEFGGRRSAASFECRAIGAVA
jgi:hypothetical protein